MCVCVCPKLLTNRVTEQITFNITPNFFTAFDSDWTVNHQGLNPDSSLSKIFQKAYFLKTVPRIFSSMQRLHIAK